MLLISSKSVRLALAVGCDLMAAAAALDSFSLRAAAASNCVSVRPLLLLILCLTSTLSDVLDVCAVRLPSMAC
jgi:hypothetical protein